MVAFEKLLTLAEHLQLQVYEKDLPERMKGLWGDNIIWLNKKIPTTSEKACVLAEEISHYLTTAGDITDQTKIENRKQEKKARRWAYEKLIPLSVFIEAYNAGIKSKYELAEFIGVTEDFLEQALQYYQEKYGLYVMLENHRIYFNPLTVIKVSTHKKIFYPHNRTTVRFRQRR